MVSTRSRLAVSRFQEERLRNSECYSMKQSDFVEYVVHDLLSALPGVRARAMFGGWGIYKEDVIFAIIVDDQLYFKVDKTNQGQYERHGSRPFTYQSRGKSVAMSYWEVPAEVIDDREEVTRWAEESYHISRQGKPKSPRIRTAIEGPIHISR